MEIDEGYEKSPDAPISKFENQSSNFPEGKVGKLLIRKSGKISLRLGDLLFDVIYLLSLILFILFSFFSFLLFINFLFKKQRLKMEQIVHFFNTLLQLIPIINNYLYLETYQRDLLFLLMLILY